MPTYEYRCKDCGRHLEVVQSFKDDPLTECPHCGGQLRKVFGSIGIAFKGSGFYKTDSRAAGSKAKRSESADSGSSSGESKSGGDKSATTEKTAKGSTDSKGDKGKAETKSA